MLCRSQEQSTGCSTEVFLRHWHDYIENSWFAWLRITSIRRVNLISSNIHMLSTTDREASYCLVKGKVAWAAHDCELSIESFKASDDDLNLICEIQNGADQCRLCSKCTMDSCAVSTNFFQPELTSPPNNEKCFSNTRSVQLVILRLRFLVILSVITKFLFPLILSIESHLSTTNPYSVHSRNVKSHSALIQWSLFKHHI